MSSTGGENNSSSSNQPTTTNSTNISRSYPPPLEAPHTIHYPRQPYGLLETGWSQYYSTSIGGMGGPMSSNVVFFDLETTGVNPYWDRIIEIGACRLYADDVYSTFVYPGKKVRLNPKVLELTGITEEMIKGGISLHRGLTSFMDYVGKTAILVAHNNDNFDQKFLEESFAVAGIRMPATWRFLDSYRIAQRMHPPGSTRYGLADLAKKYGVTCMPTHRALQDSLALKSVYQRMIAMDPVTLYRTCRRNEFNLLHL
jgi:DNA polymerase III epsilon subunit-like protein